MPMYARDIPTSLDEPKADHNPKKSPTNYFLSKFVSSSSLLFSIHVCIKISAELEFMCMAILPHLPTMVSH